MAKTLEDHLAKMLTKFEALSALQADSLSAPLETENEEIKKEMAEITRLKNLMVRARIGCKKYATDLQFLPAKHFGRPQTLDQKNHCTGIPSMII